MTIRSHLRTSWDSNLHESEFSNETRMFLEKLVQAGEPFGKALCVVQPIDPDAQDGPAVAKSGEPFVACAFCFV